MENWISCIVSAENQPNESSSKLQTREGEGTIVSREIVPVSVKQLIGVIFQDNICDLAKRVLTQNIIIKILFIAILINANISIKIQSIFSEDQLTFQDKSNANQETPPESHLIKYLNLYTSENNGQ